MLSIHDVPNIYHVPLLMLEQNLHTRLLERLGLDDTAGRHALPPPAAAAAAGPAMNEPFVDAWKDMVHKVRLHLCLFLSLLSHPQPPAVPPLCLCLCRCQIDSATDEAVIALVGKYTNQKDSYLSVIRCTHHPLTDPLQPPPADFSPAPRGLHCVCAAR